jgi:hypothetical protein
MLQILNAKYLTDYKLDVTFNDNKQAVVDLKDFIFNDQRGIFTVLQDKNKFKQFNIDYTICWNEDIDIAPEFLYFKAFEHEPSLQSLFKSWGYSK